MEPAALAPPPVASAGRWSVLREALRGSRRDYTEGAIGPAIIALAIPMVLEMIMESVFAVCDVFFVSRLGADAVATVGLTESILSILYALAFGLSIGATAIVARRTGEHDAEGASRAAVQALVLGIATSLVLGALGLAFGPRLLSLMGASTGVLAIGSRYARIMLGGNATILLLFLINAVFRGAGDAALAMRTLWLANAINIGLGPCLIFGLGPFPRMGVAGAALATNIGRGSGVLFALAHLLGGRGRVRVHRRNVKVEATTMLRLIRLSSSGAIQAFIGTASWIGLVRILASFGSAALAGYTIAIRVILFALLPSWGLSNAAATMVGQSLGAGKPERAERAVWRTAFYNLWFLGAVGVVFIVFARPIVSIFTPDPLVGGYARDGLRIVASGFAFYAYGMVLTQSFNGAGDTLTPTILNVVVFWCAEIPLAYVLADIVHLGPRGVFASIALAFSALAVLSGVIFRRGTWKQKKV